MLVAAVGACDPATLKHTPDATKQIDGAPDAPNHGPVTVTVYDFNNPGNVVTGVPVVFIEADGTVAAKPVTDTLGIATADVHPGASATAVITAQGNDMIMTLADIRPGDHINLGPVTPFTSTTDGTFTVSYPSYSGATYYDVVGPCGYYNAQTALSYAMTITTDCKQSAMDILVVANNASGPIGYLEKPNVAYTPGGSTFVSGSYLLPATFSASYTNVDASVTGITFTRYVPARNGFTTVNSGTPANGTLSLNTLALNGQSSRVQTRASRPNELNNVFQNMAGNLTSYSMDMGATLLPWLNMPVVDLANKKVMIPVDTTGTTSDKPDVFVTSFSYSRTNGSAGTTSYRWFVIAPEAADITLPPLPADVGDVLPQSTDTLGTVLAVMDDTSTTTWDDARVNAVDFVDNITLVNDTTTRIRQSAYQPPLR